MLLWVRCLSSKRIGPINVQDVPEHLISWKFSRASGPGGQNVNKINSKVDMRIILEHIPWLGESIRNRIQAGYASHIKQDPSTGLHEISIIRSNNRTQEGNRQACLERFRDIVQNAMFQEEQEAAGPSPEQQARVKRLNQQFNEHRLEDKKHLRSLKQSRAQAHRRVLDQD